MTSAADMTRDVRKHGKVEWKHNGWRVVDDGHEFWWVEERFFLLWWRVDCFTYRDSAIRYARAMGEIRERFA